MLIVMITKIHIKGYRKFTEVILTPNQHMNILVGPNEAGKSTVLEAITMALTGKYEGINARECLTPYWFNRTIVDEFFDYLAEPSSEKKDAPEFRIDVYLAMPDGDAQKMRGINNMRQEDSVGLSIHAHPDPDYAEELEQYFGADNCPRVLPIEYYRLDWRDFAGQPVWRKPKGLGVSIIDTRTIRSDRGMDYHTRQLIEERLDPKVRNQVSVEHRKMREALSQQLLDPLNAELRNESATESELRIGIQVDQSRSTSWANTLVPAIDRVPFTQVGKGAQAFAKTILAIDSPSNEPNVLLIEEPENHLSHTRLRQLLCQISRKTEGRQGFITTHSSYVLNRLGLNQLLLLNNGSLAQFDSLNKSTVEYFKRLSGFDTLRLVLADKIVLVEGPSDEILFNKFFEDRYGCEPLDQGIDVISINGVSFRRGFELAALLNKKLVGLRDNDGQPPEHWEEKLKDFTTAGRRGLFVSDPECGKSLEDQLVAANCEESLRAILGLNNEQNPANWMTKNKTEAALRIATSNVALHPPSYFSEAMEALEVACPIKEQ